MTSLNKDSAWGFNKIVEVCTKLSQVSQVNKNIF